MEYTVDEVMKYIEEEDAKFIRLAFRDAFGVQYHPEFKSRPNKPHPLFSAFIGAALRKKEADHENQPTL